MPVRDGESCPGCGLPNYSSMCPHCSGDQQLYEEELAPYFGSSIEQGEPEEEQLKDKG